MAPHLSHHPTIAELEQRFARLAAEVARRAEAAAEAKNRAFNPLQPRVPAGSGRESGRWTSTGGVVATMPGATPAQQARLQASADHANAIVARVRQIDPNWRPTPSAFQTVEGAIAHNKAVAQEAARRIGDLLNIPYGPGPFAGRSVPTSGPYPTAAERREVNAIGRDTGCHTCGTTRPGTPRGNFVCDHQTPTALNRPGTPQRLFPHCWGCSNSQGGFTRFMLRSD